jgi:hypothetical protein
MPAASGLDVLHRDVVGGLEFAAVVDGDYVRLRESSRRLGLAAEALDELWVLGEVAVQDLECDRRCRCVSSASQTSAMPPPPIRAGPGSGRRRASLARPQPTSFSSFSVQDRFRDVAEDRRGDVVAELSVHSTVAAIAIFGSSAGAKPMNQAWFSSTPPPQASLPGVSAVRSCRRPGRRRSPRWCRSLR